MPWKPGQSGNPAGKPPKSRALTEILEAAGNKTLADADGKKVARKRLLAQLLWEVATTGKATFPDGRVLEVAPVDYLTVVKFLYQHIDGPPKSEVDVTSGGQAIVKAYISISPDDWDTAAGDVQPIAVADSAVA